MRRLGRIGALALAALASCAVAQDGTPCRSENFRGVDYTLCEVDVAQADLRLFLYDESGAPFGHFSAVDRALAEENTRLVFGMNAGMFHEDRAPVGLYVEDGREIRGLVEGASPGNFGLVPNGVFCLREGRADVMETSRFAARRPDCRYASQSGPMLVIDGELHPRFLKDGSSVYVRNGVGTTSDGSRAVFVLSEAPVNFHQFGSFFRDHLGLPQALYFDGNVSRLHAPGLGRSDFGFSLGPIVGLVAPAGS
ncbi:phosphodiester glycosidase family protein [Sulfitobacter sp. D35]|uniref:phosphodiester glycosidase family protein n=1 Tax=Sulfitobacter sp. D35 TaxID=3083252 RepID=UPI00296F66CC|nr:phosphodiester glycosidase family protein [Sulfitobacter sp. D35]MDW4498382.1 phosphodiester glycosidase family protein [Sulfitobacter sp. D35]